MSSVLSFSVSELQAHPWQVNIPDLSGGEWQAFLADVKERGLQEPISVSLRTGQTVVVDGHQRLRAAKELGLETISAIPKRFDDEGAEIIYLAGAARFRRHLNDAQRVEIGKAYEAFFRPIAAERVGGRPKKETVKPESGDASESQKPCLNLDKVSPADTTKQAAETVGMSRAQYAKGKKVSEQASEPVKEAWQKGEISTHKAYKTIDNPIQNAVRAGEITPIESVALEKNKELKSKALAGSIPVAEAAHEAVALSDVMQQKLDEENRVMGRDIWQDAHDDLDRILNRSTEGWLEALNTRMNTEVWKGSLIDDIRYVINHLQEVEREATTDAYTLTV